MPHTEPRQSTTDLARRSFNGGETSDSLTDFRSNTSGSSNSTFRQYSVSLNKFSDGKNYLGQQSDSTNIG